MKKKLVTVLLGIIAVSSLAACGSSKNKATDTATNAVTEKKKEIVPVEASIDFEDEKFGFAGMDMTKEDADESVLSIVDYNGSKALKVEVQKDIPYVAFNLDGLLGEDIEKVKSIQFDIGIDKAGEEFFSNSGKIYAYSGTELTESCDEWSVYMENSNPKRTLAPISEEEAFVAGAGNYIVISKETDNAKESTGTPVSMYIDNIRFLDSEGNLLEANTDAVYVKAGDEESGMALLSDIVKFEGFSCEGAGWEQNGFAMPQEIIDALVPGSVVQISYTSKNADMWLVMPDATVGWTRIGDGNNGTAIKNKAGTIARIPYEMIAKYCGDDKSAWGARMQCEASGPWQVFDVSVGMDNHAVPTEVIEFEGFSCTGKGWEQNGFTMPPEIIDAFEPESIVKISYTSENEDMWLVMPDAALGWTRVGDGNNGQAECINGVARIPYEMIAQYCGDDKSAWGTRMQCESSGAWEVYAVSIEKMGEAEKKEETAVEVIEFENFACTGEAWKQNGFEMPEEIIDALVPGSVIKISFTSPTEKIWLVMPDASSGWMRIGDGVNGQAACANGIAEIPYEMIAQYCGEDKTAWGTRMQCESDDAWEVHSVSIEVPVIEEAVEEPLISETETESSEIETEETETESSEIETEETETESDESETEVTE